MSANLIGFGCDLQQKLDTMDARQRKTRWAGDGGHELHRIARKLHALSLRVSESGGSAADDRRDRRLLRQAQTQVDRLGKGIQVYRQGDPTGWPLYIVFPGDVPRGQGVESYYEQGIAVPPRP